MPVAALATCYVAARRASLGDPLIALRCVYEDATLDDWNSPRYALCAAAIAQEPGLHQRGCAHTGARNRCDHRHLQCGLRSPVAAVAVPEAGADCPALGGECARPAREFYGS